MTQPNDLLSAGIVYMGWHFDKKATPLQKAIDEATAHFEAKYGVDPNVALVNPESHIGSYGVVMLKGLSVEPSQYVRPGNVFVGKR